MMKKFKVSLSALAVVLGMGAAFATTPVHHFANKKWARISGTGMYLEVTGQTQGSDYSCTQAASTCTASFRPMSTRTTRRPMHIPASLSH